MKSLLLFTVLLFLLFSGCKKSSEWAQWRGPNGDGISKEENWSADKLDSSNILWTKNIGFGHSAISVKGNRCYLSGWKEEISGIDTIPQTTLYCFDVSSGNEVWKFSYPSARRSYPGPRSTPVLDENNLYVLSWEGKLFCLDAKTGKEKWTNDLIKDSLAVIDQWGCCPSPVIYEDLILLNLNKSGIALNKNNGKVVWNSAREEAHYASAQLVTYKNKKVAVFMSGPIVYLVEPSNGDIVTQFNKTSEKGMENDVIQTSSGMIFTSNELLEPTDSGLKSVWLNDTVSSLFRTGVVIGDYAYQLADNKNKTSVNCVDLKNGIPVWSASQSGYGSLIAVNDKLIVLTGLGEVIIADATPVKFILRKRLQVFSPENKSPNWCWTAPSFLDGKLFIRNSGGEMACINLES